MNRISLEYMVWTALIVGGGMALLMYQQATHANVIAGFLTGDLFPGGTEGPSLSGYKGQSNASGVWTPTGPTPSESVFPWQPNFLGPTGGAFPGINPSRADLVSPGFMNAIDPKRSLN